MNVPLLTLLQILQYLVIILQDLSIHFRAAYTDRNHYICPL